MSFADISIFQNIIFALIGILNPWPSLDNDTKAAFIEKSLNASIQIMRSYNIETVYENLEIDTYRDLVSLQGLQFKYYITTENELCSYENMHTEAYANFEDYLGCPINISLDSLDIEGLLSIDKKKFKQKFILDNLKIDTSLLDNSPEAKAMKKLFDITEIITLNLIYDSEYYFNINKLLLNFVLDLENFAKIEVDTTINRLNFPLTFDVNNESFKFTVLEFSSTITDNGLVEKINLISELNNKPTLDKAFLDLTGMSKEQFNVENLTPSQNIFKEIHFFLKNPGVISCVNSSPVSIEATDFQYAFDLSEKDNLLTKLCSVIMVN